MDEATRYAKDVSSLPADHPYAVCASLLPERAVVLDVGCASGEIGAFLKSRGHVVDGIEANEQRAALAIARLDRVIVGLGGDDALLPRLRDHYDAVVLIDVLEHVRDAQRLLRWCTDRLGPDGTIVALVPNGAHWTARLKILRGDWTYTETGVFDRDHVRFYDVRTLGEVGRAAGLREVERHHFTRPRRRKRWAAAKALLARLRPSLFAYYIAVRWER